MNDKTVTLRSATPADAPRLLEIYGPYVTGTAITFEYEIPTQEEFSERIRRTLERYPYLVAERDGTAVGYAYASPFHPREAYGWAAEVSIYLDQSCRGKGIGRVLYDAMEDLLRRQGILNLNACIALPRGDDPYLTLGSVAFHQKLGYQTVGHFHQCGYKFGRWYDMVWMEKIIAEHPDSPSPVIPFPEL
ncbi:MAG: GNAT family N-acetyltransferase [Oscillospiraceae bacterium]|nr:GNAT family N-acetyltransferase [Oscillospiraceae bacterium]